MNDEELWGIICELSPDESRRGFARAILEKRPHVVDVQTAREEFERARALLLGMREVEAWAALLCQNPAWARLLDVHSPVAATMLRNAARRALSAGGSAAAAAVDRSFRAELGKVQLAPARRGPQRDRLPDYLADRVVLAYRWLAREAPPAGDPYDAARSVAGSRLYRLGEAAFRAHGVPWYASRLRDAVRRDADGMGLS